MEKEENISPEPSIQYGGDGKVSKKDGGKIKSALAVPISIIIAGLLIAGSIILTNSGGIKISKSSDSAAITDENLKIRDDDHVFGNKKADVLLFVWSDPECPFCKRHHATLNDLLKKYDGKIGIVYRHFALDFHTYAKKEAESIECAGKVGGEEGFKKYVDKLFEITEGNNNLKREDLTKIATMTGLNSPAFESCVDSGEMTPRIEKDIQSGVEAGVMGTPYTIAVNTKTGRQREINGAQPIEMITATLTQLMK